MKYNVGVDLVKISRFNDKSLTFAKRILSQNELEEYNSLPDEQKTLFLARSWAIKEAIFKANNEYFDFSKISLRKENKVWKFEEFAISISHEDDFLIAFVIVNKET
ncbi:4'-phosphopantetheinyl transferase superfamily protein [Mycoplasma sp. CSL7503-lung]|uniref:4'-phosphopantetheinyl transferase superfamily protein n=1 Tax=Mycoplasma sp. CSL7503-lung TaxID=536372 RepID=UPI0021D0BA57|nr:4'-phosphopantetheinyl transferase superfamily protein [Mycoplasma sp. CSL7503-lung]MCU4706930.1 4'-phosphopantetheinyl transferase superfamily protein [Mycoplasma sp. CSL7503-lung]